MSNESVGQNQRPCIECKLNIMGKLLFYLIRVRIKNQVGGGT